MSDPTPARETPIARVSLDNESGFAQKLRSGHHLLTADEPVHAGGTDTGPAPYGLVLAGLAACTAITLRMYAQRKGFELGSVRISLTLFKSAEGTDRIERTVHLDAAASLTDEQRARLADIAEKTPVTRTLKAGAAIETTFT